jgi:hypothetical protein
MQFLTADQKQNLVTVCEELHQIASNDAAFLSKISDSWSEAAAYQCLQGASSDYHRWCNLLSKVTTGDETWIYGYDPETK